MLMEPEHWLANGMGGGGDGGGVVKVLPQLNKDWKLTPTSKMLVLIIASRPMHIRFVLVPRALIKELLLQGEANS